MPSPASAVSVAVTDINTNVWVSTAMIIVAVFFALYGLYWRVRRDFDKDGLDKQYKQLLGDLNEQLEREHTRAEAREGTIERLARERNDAVSEVGKLTAQVEMLTTQVEKLEDDLAQARAEVHETRLLLNSMQEAMNLILDGIRKLGVQIEDIVDDEGVAK